MDKSLASPAVTPRRARLSVPHLVLGVIGWGLSLYAFLLHLEIAHGGDASACGFTETIRCDKALTSEYAQLLHVPLGLWGMAFFTVVLLTAVVTEANAAPRRVAATRLLVTGSGALVSLFLIFVSATRLHVYCPVCMATHTATLLLFGLSLRDFWRTSLHPPSVLKRGTEQVS